MSRRRTLLVFARAPVAGRVKTRLIPRLGAEGALRLYRGLLADTAAVCAVVAADTTWWVDGDRLPLRPLGIALEKMKQQPEGDLGERLTEAFAQAFAEGAEQVAVIGTDCPELAPGHIAALYDALDARHDAAVLPAADGGYAGLALARRIDGAFRNVAWSTPRTLADTLARLAEAGAACRTLPAVADLDDPADLDALLARLAGGLSTCPHTRRALEEAGLFPSLASG